MEGKSREMAEEMNRTIEKLNREASALEVEKEKKAVSICKFCLCFGFWGEGVQVGGRARGEGAALSNSHNTNALWVSTRNW